MAKIFYADKKHTRSFSLSEKSENKKASKKQKKGAKGKQKGKSGNVDDSWGSSMKPLFMFMHWIARKGIYRIYRYIPLWMVNNLGHVLGYLGLGRSYKVRSKIKKSYSAIYPNMKEKTKEKLAVAWTKYMGEMLVDTMFRLPLASDGPYEMFYVADHTPLYEAFKQNKGVIVPTAHLGQFLHSPASLFQHPSKILTSGIVNVTNVPMYEACNRKRFDNLKVYASTKFALIAPFIEQDLRENRAFLTLHDYSTPTQLRVPMWEGRFPYLIHTPQSHISLAKRTGAIILPALPKPIGDGIGKTHFEYLDNSKIMEAVEKYKDAPDKVFHGMVSIEINKVMYPEIIKYMHVWEEIMNFATMRLADKLIIPANTSAKGLNDLVFEKISQIIDNSFERNRNDEFILDAAKEYKTKLTIANPSNILIKEETTIDLSLRLAVDEIITLLKYLADKIGNASAIEKLIEKIKNAPLFEW